MAKYSKRGDFVAYVQIAEKNKVDRGLGCPDCQKARRECYWRGDPPLCEKHRAEAMVERLGGRITWNPIKPKDDMRRAHTLKEWTRILKSRERASDGK